MSNVVVIDYGMGNIKSVQRGLEQVDASVTISAAPELIANADRLVLPGVGAFEDGMSGLMQSGLDQAIHRFVEKGNPLLGICLGMQMLLQSSEEHGVHQGLGLIDGNVRPIPQCDRSGFRRKTPHIGWSALKYPSSQDGKRPGYLQDIEEGEFFYFVHSYMADLEDSLHRVAYCEYEGLEISAVIQRDNVTGLQFHPEKSGAKGLKILRQFMSD